MRGGVSRQTRTTRTPRSREPRELTPADTKQVARAVAPLLVVLWLLGSSFGAPSAGASGSALAWAPPDLVSPTVIALPTTSIHLELDPSKDYILQLPVTGLRGALWVEGGHNVVLIGGTITVPSTANQTDNGADNTDTGIYIKNATGTVHLEGLVIDADPGVMFDGIDINAPQATVQIENVRITDLWGSDSMMHADAVQTWGGVKDLRIDDMSVDGDYQGLTIDPDLGPVGSAEIENVDLTIDPIPAALASETEGGGHMIWLTRGATSCDAPSSVSFQNVYIDASQSDDETGGGTVWPSAENSTLPCAAVLQGDEITWPSLSVTGSVTLGTPPNGSFVPRGTAGNSYRSPFAPTNTEKPQISGIPEVGETLTASAGSWTANAATISYQWQRAGSSIPGSIAPSYQVTPADLGSTLSVLVTATNDSGSGTADSAPTTNVAAAPVDQSSSSPVATTPSVPSLPPGTCSASQQAGRITVSASVLTPPGAPALGDTVRLSLASKLVESRPTVQWQIHCRGGWAALEGATSRTLTLKRPVLGKRLRALIVTGSGAEEQRLFTTPTLPVVSPAALRPHLKGRPRLGATMHVRVARLIRHQAGLRIRYLWQRLTLSRDGMRIRHQWETIRGARSASYRLDQSLAGARVRVVLIVSSVTAMRRVASGVSGLIR